VVAKVAELVEFGSATVATATIAWNVLINSLRLDIFKKEMCEKWNERYLNGTFLLSAPCSLRHALCALRCAFDNFLDTPQKMTPANSFVLFLPDDK
jgi:hypothetical protein